MLLAIPIGRYGSSNVGRAKTVYRIGLAHRYGRRMQTISGIHYNFSLPAIGDPNVAYFSLIRNFRRHSWLLLYLFGASPAVCGSFVEERKHELVELKPGTMYRPGATSLRMGPLGYQSDAQASLAVSYNNLDSYGASLQDALTRPYPPYETIGIREPGARGDGIDSYRQLATSLLQIENEFYGTIRPKRVIRQGERPLHALRERGVEYVEVRLMDLDPFEPVGINAATIRLLDVFLLHCLLSESPPDSPDEIAANARNQHRVAARGREAGLRLERSGEEISLADWGKQVLAGCESIAAALDVAHGGNAYRDALSRALSALDEPAPLASARVLKEMAEDNDSYVRFVLRQSRKHLATIGGLPLSAAEEKKFAQSPETYFGSERNEFLAGGKRFIPGTQTLSLPSSFAPNALYLGGTWNFTPEYAESVSDESTIVFHYKARDVYFVGSSGSGITVEILQDGKPIGSAAGKDVGSDGTLMIKDERLYKLIRNPSGEEHVLEIRVKSKGLKAFTFTFG